MERKRRKNSRLTDTIQEMMEVEMTEYLGYDEYQYCIVHQVRNTLKYVSDKDKKS